METNALPKYDRSDNPTDCCPRFDPEPWDGQELHFKDKLFLKAKTRSLFHIPINMGSVFSKTFADIEKADALSDDNFIVLSHDPSAWKSEHLFAVTQKVPNHDSVELTGDFFTKAFEGPYKDAPRWIEEMESYVAEQGRHPMKTYFFYTTCPKCSKTYGKNYVVAVTQVN